MRTRATFAVTVVLLALICSLSASASFPGANGKIVFGSQHAGEDEIWVMNPDGTNRRNLTRSDGRKVTDIDPRWSPDGRRIAFASDRTGSLQIWTMNANGRRLRQVTDLPGRNRFPSWTSDGKHIVFQSVVAGSFEIFRVKANGRDVVNLTQHAAVDWSPATSPSGGKIVFTSERDGNGHLYLLASDGELTRVTNDAGYDFHANWSPDGDELAFVRGDASGENEIYVVRVDGAGEARQLTSTPDRDEFFPAFSPDGTKVTYSACGPPPTASSPNPRCTTHVMNADGTGDVDLAFPPFPFASPFVETFDDNRRDVDFWHIIHEGDGVSVRETRRRVQVSFSRDAAPFPGGSALRGSYGTNCLFTGDFDAQVDFELLDWPTASGFYVELNAFNGHASMRRASETWGESYNATIGSGFGVVPTLDRAGSLRLVRANGTMTGYYRSGGAWVELASAPAASDPVIMTFAAGLFGAPIGAPVRVAFDNFRIEAGDTDCSQLHPDWHPDWQPLVGDDDDDDDDDD